jgi:uncharacterized membrane protein (UPF0127 family)
MSLIKVKRARSFLEKTLGLIVVAKKDFDFFYLFDFGFESRWFSSAHTFLMSYDVAMFFLDENFKIVEIIKRVESNKFVIPKCKCRYLVELPISLVGCFCIGDDFKENITL